MDDSLKKKVADCKIFLVGCGGLGVEILKNLVLAGFKNLHIIDMDTIVTLFRLFFFFFFFFISLFFFRTFPISIDSFFSANAMWDSPKVLLRVNRLSRSVLRPTSLRITTMSRSPSSESRLSRCEKQEKMHVMFSRWKNKQTNNNKKQEFDLVLNALDNLDARRHMNRVCLAAKVPLIESGTAGYLGQVQVLFFPLNSKNLKFAQL